jgi:phosphocarrier protein FPr
MVIGAGPEILRIIPETPLALDGNEGLLVAEPFLIEKYRKMQKRVIEDQKRLEEEGKKPARTIDGKKIDVLANISSIPEGRIAVKLGAEGVGVLRTEFLFIKRPQPPSEDEQIDFYRKIATLLSPRPLTIRVLDAGGDKNLPYLELKPEPNPSLGLRGIRILLTETSLFKTQLRAILHVSSGFKIKILLPMISSVQEIIDAKAILHEAQEELRISGIPFDQSVEVGIMVEVPSAAILAERLAKEVDFFSIGTNDLVQYVTASDRNTTKISALNDPLQPAVLRLIYNVTSAAHSAGIRVGVCGEMAGDVIAVPILTGLGIDELSMNPRAIPKVKGIIRKLTVAKAEEIAVSALKMDTPEEIRDFVKNMLKI